MLRELRKELEFTNSLLEKEQEILATVSQDPPEGMTWDWDGTAVPALPRTEAVLFDRPDGTAFVQKNSVPGASYGQQWFADQNEAHRERDRILRENSVRELSEQVALLREQIAKVKATKLPEPGKPYTGLDGRAVRDLWRWFYNDGYAFEACIQVPITSEIPGEVVYIDAADPNYRGFYCLDERGRVIR